MKEYADLREVLVVAGSTQTVGGLIFLINEVDITEVEKTDTSGLDVERTLSKEWHWREP